jgi:dethiobiotin synthetase
LRKLYISGTDTDIGKTYFAGLLCKHLKEKGESVCYIKPVQTGFPVDDDSKTVREISGLSENDCKVLYTAEPPVAPYIVFDEFPFEESVETINNISGYDWLIVEGAGGIMVPLDSDYMNHDLVRECDLETVIVVPNRLGCINHSLLNKHFLESEKLKFFGFAMNDHFASTKFDKFNVSMLNDLTDASVRFVFSKDFEFINL